MRKTNSPQPPKKLMNELDDLVHFLADGPEVQQEMKLPQDELFQTEGVSAEDNVPVLTAPVDEDSTLGIDSEADRLVDELVDQILPKLESELRRRLKNKFSDSNS